MARFDVAQVQSGRMPEIDRPIGVVCQQCPSCESAEVIRTSVEAGKVWLVCGRCALRWSIAERRQPPHRTTEASSAGGR
jgi:hypothetical protein